MTVPDLMSVALGSNLDGGEPSSLHAKPLLVVGPSLGTSVTPLWAPAAEHLREEYDVVGWELPGHGRGTPVSEPFTVEELGPWAHNPRMVNPQSIPLWLQEQSLTDLGLPVNGSDGIFLQMGHANGWMGDFPQMPEAW